MAITTLNSTDSGATSRTVINDNFTDLDTTKADLASPTFTGTLTVPAIKLTTGAASGYLLTSDADGDATWTANTGAITIETTAGATHSLTTTAGQKVIVWAKGTLVTDATTGGAANSATITMEYNAVTKDTVVFTDTEPTSDNYLIPFSLMYTETPGAATQNITVSNSDGSLQNVVIIVMKIG